MQSVVEDLISLSRIEAERFTTPTAAVSLPPLIAQRMNELVVSFFVELRRT